MQPASPRLDREHRSELLSMNKRLVCGLAMVAGLGLFVEAVPANATPIGTVSFYNDASTLDTLRFTLNCGSATGSCAGQIEALYTEAPSYTFNATVGDMFALGKSGIGTETNFVNTATNSHYSTGTQIGGNGDTFEFTTDAKYFLIKTGNGGGKVKLPYALIYNVGGGPLDLFFQSQHTGTGFSHFTVFGGTPVTVPEPAALGMLGFGVLLIGAFTGLRRRYN